MIRSATDVSEDVRAKLERRVQSQLMATVQAEERIVADRAERTRLDSAAEQRTRTIDLLQRDKQTIEAMMIQFDLLMKEGVYNVLYSGGMGNIVTTSAPFGEARLLAQQAYALQRGGPLPYSDNDPAPTAGYFTSYAMGFYSQEIQFRALTKYRFLLTMQDVTRASVPFPDTQTIEYPDAAWWRYISEKRIKKYGKAVDLFDRDEKTKRIIEKLDEPISMSFNEETPLEDVLKYIKQATTTATYQGIPIYVDPIGLSEADKTMTSTVRNMDLEGVPLKLTLKLLLNQLDLTYTVKDGFLMITSKESEDQQTEIRVYPVADLAIIPLVPDGRRRHGRHGRRYGWRRHGRRHGWHGRWHGRHGRRHGRRHGWRHGRHDVGARHRSSAGSPGGRRVRSKKKQLTEAVSGFAATKAVKIHTGPAWQQAGWPFCFQEEARRQR